MGRLTADLILSLTDRVTRPARDVERSMERLQRQSRQTGRLAAADAVAMGRANATMLAGAAGSAAILGPAAAAFVGQKVVAGAADFESALTGIQKKAGTTAAETAKIGEEIKALATSGELASPIAEIAAAYERGAAAGIPLDELRQFSKLSAMAADAFEMSATDVGNAAAGFNKILKIPMSGMQRYFDLINGIADAGIADERDIVDFADRAGSSLKTFGLQNEEIAALGATMGNLKVPADVAANAMKTFVTRIRAPGKMDKAGVAWLTKLVGNLDVFQKKVDEDANGAMLELLDSLDKLEGAAKVDAISRIAGGNYDDNIMTLVDNLDEYRRNLAYARNESQWFGSLSSAYQLKLDDFWSQWQLVKNALEELTIDTGTMGMPAFKAALDGAQALIEEIDAGLEHFKARVDVTEVNAAMQSIRDLGGQIHTLMSMAGADESPILKFFDRLASTANLISGTVEASKDVLQGIGLVEADGDTPETRTNRRRDLVDDYATFNPYLGGAIKDFRDRTFGDTEGSNFAADDARERSLDDFLRADGIITPGRTMPAERSGRVTQPGTDRFGSETPAATGDLQASMNALAAAMVDLATPRSAATVPSTSTLPASASIPAGGDQNVPVPTPRPNIAGPLREEGDRAKLQAEEIGQAIQQATSVTSTPIIDTSSIRAAQREANTLQATLQKLSTMSLSLGNGRRGGGLGGVDGVHADTTYPGY